MSDSSPVIFKKVARLFCYLMRVFKVISRNNKVTDKMFGMVLESKPLFPPEAKLSPIPQGEFEMPDITELINS